MKTGNTHDLLRGMAIRLAWRPVPNRPCAQRHVPTADEDGSDSDARAALLSEVDFKWLMAGQGCWVDIARFHHDPAYALAQLEMGLKSSTYELRQCAARLQDQISSLADSDSPELPADALGILSYVKAHRPLIHNFQPVRETSDSSRSTHTC